MSLGYEYDLSRSDTVATVERWFSIFKFATAFLKALQIFNVVMIGCGPLLTDSDTKVGYLVGTVIWALAAYANGKPL